MSKKEEPQTQNGVSEELQKRVDAFMEGYKSLVKEHQVDIASYPVFTPDGQNGFKTIIQSTPVDIKNQPQKSPFVAEDKE